MQNTSSPEARVALLRRFRQRYFVLAAVFATITALVTGWFMNRPTSISNGLSWSVSLPILLVAAVLINSLSFLLQDVYVRRLLRHPEGVAGLNVAIFTLRFYLSNLAVAVALGALLYVPLLFLFFFYAPYPIISWLVPYHLLMGVVLGADLKRGV
ncbi:MAG: hypothetical protein H7Z42_21815 [Roseiflexaceae bacterium]|nr:hypothetical protein [Roseiflexaceae bacterium]